MRKITLLCSMIALFSGLAQASDGTINFTGEIIDTACTVDTTSQNLGVELGKVSKTAFTGGAGSTAALTEFDIVLKNCPEATTIANIKFDGTEDAGNPEILATTGAATGVGIQILDANKNIVPLMTASADYTLLATEDNNLTFFAQYISTSATVGIGAANGTANFTVNYN